MSWIAKHGPTVGQYRNKPIHDWILGKDGTRYEYRRIAVETNGGVELSQLKDDECVLAPGLIYQRIPNCTRSHPHENMNEQCQRKTEEAKAHFGTLINEGTKSVESRYAKLGCEIESEGGEL